MGAFSLSIELDRSAERFAPLRMFMDRKTTIAAIAFGTGGLPLLTSGIVGLIVGWLLVFAPTHLPNTGASLSARALCLMVTLTVTASAAASAWLSTRMLRPTPQPD